MEREPGSIVIGLGQSAKPFPREVDVFDGKSPLGPLEKMHSRAIAVVANSKRYSDSSIWLFGADISGYHEASEMNKQMLSSHPNLEGRITLFDGVDTSTQAERIRKELSNFVTRPEVILVSPLDHTRRAKGQIEAWGSHVDKVYESHWVYVKEPGITDEERERRKNEVISIYFAGLTYLTLMREFGMNVLGLVDPKGQLIGKIAERFR